VRLRLASAAPTPMGRPGDGAGTTTVGCFVACSCFAHFISNGQDYPCLPFSVCGITEPLTPLIAFGVGSCMAIRTNRLRRAATYQHNRALSRSVPRSVPGTLRWIQARQQQNPLLTIQPMPPDRPEFYTRDAAAKRLGVGKTTVWELTRRGLIGVAYIGSKPVIPAVELDRYIASLVEQARERAAKSYRPMKRTG
jgi:excisionase family DNA binding protein